MANILVPVCKNINFMLGLRKFVVQHSALILIKQTSVRSLYASATLGLDTYIQNRQRTHLQLSNIAPRFREKMLECTSDDSNNMVFTEDLKNMLHLADGDDDIILVIKMMKRFNQQNKQLRFGSFVFGPVVMRMFHYSNKPDLAFQCFKDEDLNGMFDQIMTYQILLDLLFENQKYDEMLEAFEVIKGTQIEGIKYAKNVVVLVFAACYKMNTPESLKYALKLWGELQDIGHLPLRRAITFCAGLAINQGNSVAALEMLSTARTLNYITVRNLKVSALVDVKRIEEAIQVLKSIITTDTASIHPIQSFDRDVVDKVKFAVEKLGDSDVTLDFNRVYTYLEKQGHICDKTLDEHLCQEISPPAMIGRKVNENFIRYDRRNQFGNKLRFKERTFEGQYTRPGLADLQ